MSYCVRSDVERLYGMTNVSKWADLDNDQDAAKITARITAMITSADEEIDSRLRGGRYEVPIIGMGDTGSVPRTILDLSALKAGLLLYEDRGATDYDPNTGQPAHRYAFQAKTFERVIRDITIGRRLLDAVYTTDTHCPQVVPAEDIGLIEVTGFEVFDG